MRIVTVSDIFPNGEDPVLGTFCLERVKALAKVAEVRVIAPVPYWPSWSILRPLRRYASFARIGEHEVIDGIQVEHPRRVVIPRVGLSMTAKSYRKSLIRALGRLREEFPFDVLDAHFVWAAGYAAVEAGKEFGVPVCITAHGSDVTLAPNYRRIRPFVDRTLAGADRLVTVSQALADILIDDLGAPAERVRVIHNGVDASKFRRIDRAEARQALGLRGEGLGLISIGALIPLKGHEYLIDAAASLVHRDGMRDLQLNIVGDGPLRHALQKRIALRNLGDHVRLVGPIPHGELYRWISASDYFCLSSSREGWPTVFFESWACGVPVIATSVQGVPEAICSDRYGLLVAKQDAELMAQAIKRAMSMPFDPNELMAYAANNTWDLLQGQHLRGLEEIIAARRGDVEPRTATSEPTESSPANR